MLLHENDEKLESEKRQCQKHVIFQKTRHFSGKPFFFVFHNAN